MALLDVFKKKKGTKEAGRETRKTIPIQAKPKPPKPKAKAEPKKKEAKDEALKPPRAKIIGAGFRILRSPHVTEKASDLAQSNQYIFKVWPRSNKTEIKRAIENLYGIDVLEVRIIKIPAKKRRVKNIEGFRKGYKKAIVKIKEGQKIEVLPR